MLLKGVSSPRSAVHLRRIQSVLNMRRISSWMRALLWACILTFREESVLDLLSGASPEIRDRTCQQRILLSFSSSSVSPSWICGVVGQVIRFQPGTGLKQTQEDEPRTPKPQEIKHASMNQRPYEDPKETVGA